MSGWFKFFFVMLLANALIGGLNLHFGFQGNIANLVLGSLNVFMACVCLWPLHVESKK